MQVSVLERWFLCMFSFLERKFLIKLVHPSFQSMSDYLSVREELEMNFCGLLLMFENVSAESPWDGGYKVISW